MRFYDLADGQWGEQEDDRAVEAPGDPRADRPEMLDTRPLGVAYRITAKGETALRFLDELRRWSEEDWA